MILVLVSAALLALAPAARAVDGVVLINQSTAINGLPGCPLDGGELILICQPGSYRLGGNLAMGAKAYGILIRADNVTLDLNGFAVAGPGPGTATQCITSADAAGNPSGTRHAIANGIVTGCGYGINLNAAASVSGITADDCNISVQIVHDGKVSDSTIENSARYGIQIGAGMVIRCRIVGGTPLYGVFVGSSGAVLESEIGQASSAILGASGNVGYGLNLFHDITHIAFGVPLPEINGGISMGNNICSNFTKC
ncbi:MAG: hypothetical protein ACRD1E_03080 [Terriglobales bacterium]